MPPARLFNNSPISPRKCRILLTKIALLIFTGESFPSNEATSLFFGISKLFQNKDPSLRQMMYLVIKELASSASDVIMMTQSIMKDTGVGSDVLYKANAIRALSRIIDVGYTDDPRVRILTGNSLRLSTPLSGRLKTVSSTRIPRSRLQLWFHPTISSL